MKKIIRLTKSDLHRLIIESTKRVLNEIGDTQRGQFMLGRLSSRKNKGDDFERRMGHNVYKTATPNGGIPSDSFSKGETYQDNNTNKQINFQYDTYKMDDMDKLGSKFINFIEKYDGGVLLQTVVDYESGNQTGEPSSPVPELISEFEDNVLGYECTDEMKDAIEKAYNKWWFYASDQLMPQDSFEEANKHFQ